MDLEKIRKKIDFIDAEIVKLLNERMEFALRTKKLKENIVDAKREEEVFGQIRKYSQGLIRPEFSGKVFDEIIKESVRLQEIDQKLVGFQGEHGAFGEVAIKKYDASLVPIPCMEFIDVFEGVRKNQLDFGLVPVENSLEGAVTQVNDLLVETDLSIVGEINTPITHCLLALPETDYREIRVVYSHPQALAQCRKFISRNKLEPRPFYDTAGAAKMLSKEKPRAASAVASKLCAELYNLEIIKENIEDTDTNSTRFILLSKEKSSEKGDKCSVIFSTKHQAGALFSVLELFAKAEINLTRIESRPIRTDPGNYAFLLDFQGSDEDGKVIEILEKTKEKTSMYKFLGCYREAQR
ncbi:prephenate dehydratase [Candidatus Micrarchaeota archaeon]|nr:prephenate dehydratase [Candidatus Micrarchaeota archaeon]